MVVAAVPNSYNQPAVEVSYGVSVAPWKAVGSLTWPSGKQQGIQFFPRVALSESRASGGKREAISVKVRIPQSATNDAYRVAAFDKSGREMFSAGSIAAIGSTVPYDYWFSGSLANLGRVELQTRPFKWFRVGSVRLEPNGL
jgi:hypothetical protein